MEVKKKSNKKVKKSTKSTNKKTNKVDNKNINKLNTKEKKKSINSIRIKGLFKKIKDFFVKNYKSYYLWMALPFILMEAFIYMFGSNISYVNYNFISPVLFTITWIILFIGISLSFKKIIGTIIYLFFNILFLIMFIVNNVYYSMTKTFFDFSLLESTSEGAPYIMDAIKNCNSLVYAAIILVIIFIIVGIKRMPKVEKNNYKSLGIVILLFLVLHLLTPLTLGKANTELTWSSWRNPKNIYNSYNDNNKSIKVSGFYEYTVRNFYLTYLKTEEQETEEEVAFLEETFKEAPTHKNKYTGKLKGKNLILVQLEGTDNWLINKNDTPTLYKMMNEGINFANHYSYYNGGGSTFNSEFAVNTGFITPLSYNRNAYSFNKNSFPYSLANLFKNLDYDVNAFHMNTGEYYSRTVNYLNWGYDNYYGLVDTDDYDDISYELDRELILNEKFNELLFNHEGNFVDYIITYSGHLPFTNTKEVCKMLYDMDVQEEFEKTGIEVEFTQMSEEECVRRQASETDYMMQLLIENLKEKNLLDNTIIVVFTDHYLYTLEDKTILDKYKNTSNNLINRTPFFIWGKGVSNSSVKKVTSQLNILPTLLNLYGIEYNTNNYIGGDALDPSYDGIVFFSDYSWYDGNVYVENGEVTNNKKITEEQLEQKNFNVNNLTRKNDLALKYDYFKNKDKNDKK